MSLLRPNIIASGIVILGIGIALYGANFYSSSPKQRPKRLGEKVAELKSWQGHVRLQSPGEESWQNIDSPISLRDKDRVLVLAGSEAIISTSSGYEIRLQENTQIVLEYWDSTDKGSPIFMHFVHGNFDLLKPGMQQQLWMVRKAQVFVPALAPQEAKSALVIDLNTPIAPAPEPTTPVTLAQKELPFPVVEKTAKKTAKKATVNEDKPVAETSNQEKRPTELPEKINIAEDLTLDTSMLSNAEIEKTISARAAQFRRCQAQSLKSGQSARGSLTVFFRIENSGNIDKVTIPQDDTGNEELGRCVITVFERIKFRPYTGAIIENTTPLNFQ